MSAEPGRARHLARSSAASAGIDRPSERTLETLKRYDLERRYRRTSTAALAAAREDRPEPPEPELVYALAELSWIEGRRLDRWRKAEAIDRYVDTVAYAYDFLFDLDPSWPPAAGRPTRASGSPATSTTAASSG